MTLEDDFFLSQKISDQLMAVSVPTVCTPHLSVVRHYTTDIGVFPFFPILYWIRLIG